MENDCRAQTPLTYQYGSQLLYRDDTSNNHLMLIQNNFEWSHQTSASSSSTDTHFHSTIFQQNSCQFDTNVVDFNSFALNSNCLELNTTFNSNHDTNSNNNNNNHSGYYHEHLPVLTNDCYIQQEEIYDLNLDDSLKNVLNEIESIPSVFLEDIPISNPSSVASIPDQEILSPSPFDLWNNVSVPTDSPTSEVINVGADFWDTFNVPEDSSVSSGESEASSDDTCLASKQLKKVNKSGRVNKRESNKVAAVRYRQKKSKERDQLFQECELYAQKNEHLKEKIADIEEQIGFIKSLLMQALAQKK